jgi:hypothetical protein
MHLRNIYRNKNLYSVLLSAVLSVVLVAIGVSAATTISTNINTGGTLTVSGDADFDTDTLYVDVSADRVGVGTSTPSAMLAVGEGSGTVTGDVYLTGGLTVGATTTINSTEGTILLANTRNANPTATEGLFYYNATDKALRLYDGTRWAMIATSSLSGGLSAVGSRIQLGALATGFLTLGTTTSHGPSLMTLEATSTNSIPLSIVGITGQTQDLFRVSTSTNYGSAVTINHTGTLMATSSVLIGGSLTVYDGAAVFNELSDNNDFRIESDGDANMFFLDASADSIGVASSTPKGQFAIEALKGIVDDDTPIFVVSDYGTTSPLFAVYGNSRVSIGSTTPLGLLSVEQVAGVNAFVVGSSSTTTLIVDKQANVGIGTSSPSSKLGVEGDAIFFDNTGTATIKVHSSVTGVGGCIEFDGVDGNQYRAYASTTGPLILESGGCE